MFILQKFILSILCDSIPITLNPLNISYLILQERILVATFVRSGTKSLELWGPSAHSRCKSCTSFYFCRISILLSELSIFSLFDFKMLYI